VIIIGKKCVNLNFVYKIYEISHYHLKVVLKNKKNLNVLKLKK